MSASLGLFRLQQVDSNIDAIHGRLNEIHQILDNDEQLQRIMQTMQEAESTLQEATNQLKKSEQETEKQKVKINASESSLYSGVVKNPKELQDLQLELAALKRHLITLEDRQLAAMESQDAAQQKLEGIRLEKGNLDNELSQQFKSLDQERAEKQKDLVRLETERIAAVNALDPDLIVTYDELRKEKNGVAVVLVHEASCSACGSTLTPAQEQNARSASTITNCPNCGRILYVN